MTQETEAGIVRQIELEEVLIKLRSDGIIHVHYKPNTILDVALQERMRDAFIEITKGQKSRFIFSADEGFILTPEARENGRNAGKTSPIMCYAVVTSNLAYKIIANFYFRVVDRKDNYKLLDSVEDAVKWLKHSCPCNQQNCN